MGVNPGQISSYSTVKKVLQFTQIGRQGTRNDEVDLHKDLEGSTPSSNNARHLNIKQGHKCPFTPHQSKRGKRMKEDQDHTKDSLTPLQGQ